MVPGIRMTRIDLQRASEVRSCLVEPFQQREQAPHEVMGLRVSRPQCERPLCVHESLLNISVIVERAREIQQCIGISRSGSRGSTECGDGLLKTPGRDERDAQARQDASVVRARP